MNDRPDEEGIKTFSAPRPSSSFQGLNDRPDEEGIKTAVRVLEDPHGPGLNDRPDEEGIKTGLLRGAAGLAVFERPT